jgi:hypothetical protein
LCSPFKPAVSLLSIRHRVTQVQQILVILILGNITGLPVSRARFHYDGRVQTMVGVHSQHSCWNLWQEESPMLEQE